MSQRISRLCLVVFFEFAAVSAIAAEWTHPLYLDGGGWWRGRVRVVVRNELDRAANGEPVAVKIGRGPDEADLEDQRAEAIRVCNEQGQEVLFAIQGLNGKAVTRGPIPGGSDLILPCECGAGASAVYYVYFDNPDAGEMPDFLPDRAGCANGDVEDGEGETPNGWEHDRDDGSHHASWSTEDPQSGKRCLKTVVDTGAAANWVSTRQHWIHIDGGAKYRMRAWVKAENVQGDVGWYLHVGSLDKPMMMSPILKGGAGTYGWKELTLEFVAPPEATVANLGTVLFGTGTAWFDHVQLECLESKRLKAAAEKPESIRLTEVGESTWSGDASKDGLPGPAGIWDHRVAVREFNFSKEAVSRRLVGVDMTMFNARTPGGVAKYLLVTDEGKPMACHRTGSSLIWEANLPALTAKTWYVYWCSSPSFVAQDIAVAGMPTEAGASSLPFNLVKNPEFASGDALPSDWTRDGAASDAGVVFSVENSSNAAVGKRCAKMHVPGDAPAQWRGWRQTVAVQPGKTYLASAWVKCKDVKDADVNVHIHRHKADGGPSKDGLAMMLGPAVRGTSDWALLSGLLIIPDDTVSLSVLLTSNVSGTVWHGGVSVIEVTPARFGEIEGRPMENAESVKLWAPPAIAKVFKEDPAPREVEPIRITAARNEKEPLQLAVRSGRAIRGARIEVEPPVGQGGAKLSDLEVNVVGYVPIDYPTNYYQSKSPAWYRKVPTQAIGCDGWAGWWPDPLLPTQDFDLAANTTQPVWITVGVPKDAKPGDYVGKVHLSADGRKIAEQDFTVHVWDFTLPDENHVSARYVPDPGPGAKWWGGDWRELRPEVVSFMAKRRLCADTISPEPVFKYEQGQVSVDFTEFDKAAERFFGELKAPYAWMPYCFYSFGWGLAPYPTFGVQPYDGEPPYDPAKLRPEFKQAYQACLKTFWEHVKAKGWEKKFVLYVSDEPFFTQPNIFEQMKVVCRMIHEVDPQIPIYSSTWNHVPGWEDSLDIWGIGHYGIVSVEQIEKLKAAGKRIWWTTDGQMCTDTPYCAVERLLPHYCFKYGAEAYEFWASTWITYDPHRFGWHAYIHQSDQPGVSYYIRYPNGDGFLIYPGHPIGYSGPISTVRLEQAREGVEDYEYLYLLRELVAKAKAAGKDVADGEKALARADGLVMIPNAGGRYSSKVLPDAREVYAVKEQVAAAIERLGR